MVKLNLCCGQEIKDGYVNIDIRPPCDIQHDLRLPLPYQDNSVDEIYSRDALNLFSRSEWIDHIRLDWIRVLKPAGRMELICRDLEYVVKQFLECKEDVMKWGWWLQCIYAGQDHEYDYFKNGFTYQKLMSDLQKGGMTNFEQIQDDPNFVHLICYKPL